MLWKVRIFLLAILIIHVHFIDSVLIQDIFFLLDAIDSSWTLSPTSSRSMICTHLVVGTKRAHHIVLIISKFARSVYSFLNISILTLKLFNFSFNNILHEMFLLSLSFNHLICCFIISRLKVERILRIAVKSVVSNYLVTSVRKLRRWL